MKIMITLVLSVSVFVITFGLTAEEGFMRAIATIDSSPKLLVSVKANLRPSLPNHIRELHGDFQAPQPLKTSEAKRRARLAKYKAFLRKQAKQRRLGLSRPNVRLL